jgi:hypothetical protein
MFAEAVIKQFFRLLEVEESSSFLMTKQLAPGCVTL